MIEEVIDWPTGPVRIAWNGTNKPALPLTGAHGFCFHRGEVLVCDIRGRGLTIPGGHLDEHESATDCLKREASEEAGVRLTNIALVGFIEVDHRNNEHFDGRYPLRSILAIYRADVSEAGEFKPRHESTDRRFVPIDQLPSVHHEWNAVLGEALRVAGSMNPR
ncbi:MAG: NUDIX domain-containing protein [Woeseiaceae bacterium]|nr:NUDIX domain-containing protein [Woeseiaceae bacterium]